MATLTLALKSLLNRKYTAALTVFSIAMSVVLLLGVERIRTQARESFANTVSGTDLIVGARSGAVQLLLYSVFRIGDATNNIGWSSYQDIAQNPKVAWTIPLSLGDAHHGFRVLGTNADYFKHYRFARDHGLELAQGRLFDDVFDAVIGADVAAALHYQLGSEMIVGHGEGEISLTEHKDKPFTVVGILAKTGTPVDRTVHVKLEGVEAMHVDWRNGAPVPGRSIAAEKARHMHLQPDAITAFLVGLKSKGSTFQVQRNINDYTSEPLLAILPGVTLQQLWDMMGMVEKALFAVSAFVVLVGLTGMLTVILTSLNERRREMAILRSVGARPWHIFSLVMGETLCLTALGAFLGMGLLYVILFFARPVIETQYGLFIGIDWPTAYELGLLGLVVLAGLLIGSIPSYRAYRYSLADGMSIKV